MTNPLSRLAAIAVLLGGLATECDGLDRYASPEDVVLSAWGDQLFISCSGSDEVVALNVRARTVAFRVPVGSRPKGLAIDRRRNRLYVANSWSDTIDEIDLARPERRRTFSAGTEPTSVVFEDKRRRLYSLNRLSGDVTVIDLVEGKTVATIPVGKGTSHGILARDRLLVSRIYPTIRSLTEPPVNEIVEIDTERLEIADRRRLEGVGAIFKIATTETASYGIAAALRPKNLIPTAQVARGGLFVNAIALFDRRSNRQITAPLDFIDNAFAQPYAIAISEKRARVYVSGSGANEIAVLSLPAVVSPLPAGGDAAQDDLTFAEKITIGRIPTGRNPRGIALNEAMKRLYVANRLDDSISIIDTDTRRAIATVFVGHTSANTAQRRGEQLFHSAEFAHSRQFSCASCHIDGLSDSLSWDLEQDGFGRDIVMTKPLELLSFTAPYKWSGATADLETECGTLSERYFFRAQGFRDGQLKDVVAFLKEIPVRPNRAAWRGTLTESELRGKRLFERKHDKAGKRLLPILECGACHPAPLFTNNARTPAGTRTPADRAGSFDTPSLVNVGYGIRFLHDGGSRTLKELWTQYNPKDLHGVTSDLNDSEIDDLVAYLATL
jgi:YVTN family beta-propeller protein